MGNDKEVETNEEKTLSTSCRGGCGRRIRGTLLSSGRCWCELHSRWPGASTEVDLGAGTASSCELPHQLTETIPGNQAASDYPAAAAFQVTSALHVGRPGSLCAVSGAPPGAVQGHGLQDTHASLVHTCCTHTHSCCIQSYSITMY